MEVYNERAHSPTMTNTTNNNIRGDNNVVNVKATTGEMRLKDIDKLNDSNTGNCYIVEQVVKAIRRNIATEEEAILLKRAMKKKLKGGPKDIWDVTMTRLEDKPVKEQMRIIADTFERSYNPKNNIGSVMEGFAQGENEKIRVYAERVRVEMGEGDKNHARTVSVFLNGLHEQNDAVRRKIRDNMSKYATFNQVIEATGRKVENKKKKDARKKTKKILAPVINNSGYERTTERSSRPSTRYQRNNNNPQPSST